jgi:allantoinase
VTAMRSAGLDHHLYVHSPLPARAAWSLPEGNRMTVVVFLYLEKFEPYPDLRTPMDPRLRDLLVRGGLGLRGEAAYEYGNRVGVFRLLDVLDRLRMSVTVPVNSAMTVSHPILLEQVLSRGYELVGHGLVANRMITNAMPEGEEVAEIANALESIEKFSGTRPRGWVSQDYGQSDRTLSILRQQGTEYFCDYGNDDQPYLTNGRPDLVSLPNQAQWDDVQMMAIRGVSSVEYEARVVAAFDQLYAESTDSARFFGLHLHPWVSGLPHRIAYVERVLDHIAQRRSTWQVCAGDIASQWNAQASLGVPRL